MVPWCAILDTISGLRANWCSPQLMTPNRRQIQKSHKKYNAVIPRVQIHKEGSRAQVMITHALSVRMSSLVSRCVHHRHNRYLGYAARILHYRNIFVRTLLSQQKWFSNSMILVWDDHLVRCSSNYKIIVFSNHIIWWSSHNSPQRGDRGFDKQKYILV